jgi:predicted HicB family RNase H-like nuclease
LASEELDHRIAHRCTSRHYGAIRAQITCSLIPGRKSLSGGNTHSPRLEVRVPADLHREITERTKRENVTVSKLVREILQRYVDEQAA